ncbi:MAG: MaoC family dehydratase [Parvularculaceae bacterium]|nr:MaoC family dehydratase [Parvularculaceae bacterium]
MPVIKVEELSEYVGKQTGISDWLTVDQDRINVFADVTEDHQFIHVNPEAAKMTPFGTTVAHGFLTLSLLSKMAENSVLILDGVKMGLNYGFDKVRFMSPVKSGKRVRGHFTLMSADQKIPGQWQFKYAVKVEIEGEEKPALAAEWLSMQFV